MKSYSTKSAASAAIRKAGLHAMTVDYVSLPDGRIQPVVICADGEDASYVRHERGFRATVNRDRAAD